MSFEGAFMVPHPPLAVAEVGRGDERQIKATLDAYDEVAREIARIRPDTIVITSPHSVMYSDYFHISPGEGAKGDFARFGAGRVSFDVRYDRDFVERLCHIADEVGLPAGVEGERDRSLDHGTMVPLYFINKHYTDYKLVRIGLSGLSLEAHYSLGRMIRSVADGSGRKTVLVSSGDLSHCQKEDGPYGYKKEGPAYDKKLMEVMGRCAFRELLDFDESFLERAEECGHRSFVIMAGAFHDTKCEGRILSHEATFGVGYGIGVFLPKKDMTKMNDEEYMGYKINSSKDPYVRLAWQTIISHVLGKRLPDITDCPGEMLEKRAGAFVSVHEHGMLRGCIGTISATCDNVAEEIRQNAVSAVARDPRFSPVRKDELSALEINVDVLSEAEPISSMDELDVKRYGVIVEKGGRRGLLLPDLDGVDSVTEQVLIAKQKAGIRADETVNMSRFEVIRHI